jgi:hypothetical protein
MYTLVDKENKIGWAGNDLVSLSRVSNKSVHTLRSWMKNGRWYENIRYILLENDLIKSNRGGINKGNEKFFNR